MARKEAGAAPKAPKPKKAKAAKAAAAKPAKNARKAAPAPKARHGGTPVADVIAKHAAAQQPPRGHVGKIISAQALKDLTRKVNGLDEQKTEISEARSELISNSVKDHQLHRKAFKDVSWMAKSNIQKAAEYWDSMKHYVHISGLEQKMLDQPQMTLEGVAEGQDPHLDDDAEGEAEQQDEEGDDTGGDDDNVSRPQFSGSRLVA